jgi:hypothetical protein
MCITGSEKQLEYDTNKSTTMMVYRRTTCNDFLTSTRGFLVLEKEMS